MAEVKIGVDADDAVRNIEQLQSVFDRFAAASEQQTTTWAAVHGEVGGLAASIGRLHETMGEVAVLMANLNDDQEKLDRSTERTGRRWQQLARHTRDAAGHIRSATDSLLKWAGISGLVMGAAGFGASHLVFDFANSVGVRRSTAMGLNTTYGGLASARTNYGRFGDADSVLGNIASAQQDPSKRLAFANLGISNFTDRDSAELLSDVLKRTKDRLDSAQARGQPLAQTAKNLHLDDLFSMGDLQRIQRDSREEVYGQADRIKTDRRGLDLAPDVQRKWQELSTQLARAGTSIEIVLVNRLVALEPGLQKLSESFTKVARTLLAKDGPASQWLTEINTGLEWLAKKIGDPQTQKDLGDFVKSIGHAAGYVLEMSKKALALLHWLAKLTGEDASTGSTEPAGAAGVTSLAAGGGIDPRAGTGGGLGGRGAMRAQERGLTSPNRGRFGRRGGSGRASDDGGEASPGPMPTAPVTNARLAAERKAYFDELARDPQLRRDVIKTASMENEGTSKSLQTVIESMVNRSAMLHYKSLRQAIHSGFYGPVNKGHLSEGLSESNRKQGEQALAAVAAGGNTIGYRTDQGMLTDKGAQIYMRQPDKSGWAKIEGENFFYMGGRGKKWAREQIEADRNYKPAAPPATAPATAPVKVTVNRATGSNPTTAIAAGAAAQ